MELGCIFLDIYCVRGCFLTAVIILHWGRWTHWCWSQKSEAVCSCWFINDSWSLYYPTNEEEAESEWSGPLKKQSDADKFQKALWSQNPLLHQKQSYWGDSHVQVTIILKKTKTNNSTECHAIIKQSKNDEERSNFSSCSEERSGLGGPLPPQQ